MKMKTMISEQKETKEVQLNIMIYHITSLPILALHRKRRCQIKNIALNIIVIGLHKLVVLVMHLPMLLQIILNLKIQVVQLLENMVVVYQLMKYGMLKNYPIIEQCVTYVVVSHVSLQMMIYIKLIQEIVLLIALQHFVKPYWIMGLLSIVVIMLIYKNQTINVFLTHVEKQKNQNYDIEMALIMMECGRLSVSLAPIHHKCYQSKGTISMRKNALKSWTINIVRYGLIDTILPFINSLEMDIQCWHFNIAAIKIYAPHFTMIWKIKYRRIKSICINLGKECKKSVWIQVVRWIKQVTYGVEHKIMLSQVI
eukprot:g6134.t1